MSVVELKNCTCGHVPTIMYRNGYSYVICKKCRKGTGIFKDWDEYKDSEKDAVNSWNAMIEREENGRKNS